MYRLATRERRRALLQKLPAIGFNTRSDVFRPTVLVALRAGFTRFGGLWTGDFGFAKYVWLLTPDRMESDPVRAIVEALFKFPLRDLSTRRCALSDTNTIELTLAPIGPALDLDLHCFSSIEVDAAPGQAFGRSIDRSKLVKARGQVRAFAITAWDGSTIDADGTKARLFVKRDAYEQGTEISPHRFAELLLKAHRFRACRTTRGGERRLFF